MTDISPPATGVEELLVDTVCKGVVALRSDALTSAWGGDTYFFCSEFCQRRFLTLPERYALTTDPASAGGDVSYSCLFRLGDDHATA